MTFYKIIFDNGKPFEEFAINSYELKNKLRDFYINGLNDDYQNDFLVYIYNPYSDNYDDITNTEVIDEITQEIINEVLK